MMTQPDDPGHARNAFGNAFEEEADRSWAEAHAAANHIILHRELGSLASLLAVLLGLIVGTIVGVTAMSIQW